MFLNLFLSPCTLYLFGHLHFTKNQALWRWFWRQISNQRTGQYHELFDLKIQIYYSHFHSIFGRSCQIHCFLHTVTAISKRLKCLSHIFASNGNWNMSSHWNSSNSVQKAVDLTTPAKNRRKMSIIDLNFHIKKFMILACTLVWNLP